MTLAELREKWHQVKHRPLWDRERSDIESALFAEFDKACKLKPVYNQNISAKTAANHYVSRAAKTYRKGNKS